jgi:nucleoside-diphosphate-sugar epimerase
MRILVIGGTRFIGAAAVRQLAVAGHELSLFHRGTSVTEMQGVAEIHGDRNDINSQRSSLAAFRPEVVLDMCCITEAQCAASMAALAGVIRRYVLVSSCDVYRVYGVLNATEDWPVDNTPQKESAPLRTKPYPYRGVVPRAPGDPRRILDDYDKIPCEQLVLSTPGVSGTVLRLPMVYGPRDYQQRLLPYLKRMDDGRPAILLGETQARWRGARGYVDDVAHAIVLAVTDERAAGRIYNVAEEPSLTEREWVVRIAVTAAWDGEIVEVPDEAIPDSMEGLRGAGQHLLIDTSRLRAELGYSEVATPADAMAASVEWQRAHCPTPLPEGMFDYEAEDELLKAGRGP